jgi:predicted TIM-barrel enzyme
MGFAHEIEMIRIAHKAGLLTSPYVFTPEDARLMTEAGADVIVPHLGLTTSGKIGAQTAISLSEAVDRVQAMHDAARAVSKDVIVLCHGGPIATPSDAAYVLARTSGIAGFFGASSVERLPTEIAITAAVRDFKSISLNTRPKNDRAGTTPWPALSTTQA